jgi:hypothetical protein
MQMPDPITLLDETTAAQHSPATEYPQHPYVIYPEFAGPGGEHHLKKLLRQILPMALYRTWEIFVEHQARGNDCYLSVPQLAVLAGRCLRTMQKNVATLATKGLLVEHAERKAFRPSNGEPTSRMVVVKDFTNLYALAHEYHTWLHSDAYIPPDRVFLAALSADPSLVAKLRRFDTYRRVLYTSLPGPGPQAHEEDRWFTAYPLGDRAPTEGTFPEGDKDARPQAAAMAPTLSANDPAKERAKDSPKRINESFHRDSSKGDSFDSASSCSEKTLKKRGHSPRNQQQEEATREMAGTLASEQSRLPPSPHPEGARSPAGHEREETSQEVRMAHQAMEMARNAHAIQPGSSTLQPQDRPPRPPDHPLARSFVQEIAAPFGDRNPKGSTTRVLGILANASLEEAEVPLCLVRAYVTARDTHTLRPAYYDQVTGQANRMPLFCTLFERFVQARLHNGKWNYSWQEMEEDIAADDRLLLWWTEHQALLTRETPDSHENPFVPAPDTRENQGEPEEAFPLVVGWARREAAHAWGEQLLEALIAGGYEAEVRVHLENRWYQLVLVGGGGEYLLETPQQVQSVIEQAQSGGLCCKDSRGDTMDVKLPDLLRSGNSSKEVGNEGNLSRDVPFLHPMYLSRAPAYLYSHILVACSRQFQKKRSPFLV